jgi:hypothetical protein
VTKSSIVGHIAAHKLDFEVANFTPAELAEVAAGLDEAHGFSGAHLRNAAWTGIKSESEFETQYRRLTASGRSSLKGEEWGRALAQYAMKHPNSTAGSGEARPLISAIQIALRLRTAHYDIEKEHFGFDPKTFKRVRQKPYPPYISGGE